MSRVFDLASTPIEDGVTLIEASAGTGKTYCLTGLVLRLLLEEKVEDVSEILVVTFTQAATQELVERIRQALRAACALLSGESTTEEPFLRHLQEEHGGDEERLARLREALVRFDDLTVATIHGFCKRALEDGAFESGMPFAAELLEDDAPILLETARDVWRRALYPAPRVVATVATEERWTPETFLPDYETWRRHPSTQIQPPPEPLERGVAALEDGFRRLALAWDAASLLPLLEGRRFRSHAYLARGSLEDHLRDAEAFCRRGAPAGLRAIRELAGPRLASTLFKKDSAGVLDHPSVRAATAFSESIDRLRHALRCHFIAEVDAQHDRTRRGALILTYDDLLRRLREALADPRRGDALRHSIRRRYRAALIDEFQDTDLTQYDIFRQLFRSGPLFLIGDPKQAIYRFRGADVFAYLAAQSEADRGYTLDRNWRTSQPLVEAINALFLQARRPFVFDRIAFEPATAAVQPDAHDEGPRLHWIWTPRYRNREESRAAVIQAVTAEVRRLLSRGDGGGGLAPDDVAILVRTNSQALDFQQSLREIDVPSVVGRSGDIFQTEEMAELQRVLSAVADPGYAPRLRAAWATRLWGDDAAAIAELNGDDEAFAHRLETFDAYRDDWRRRGLMPMIQRLLGHRRVRQRLLASTAGERRLTNLVHAIEVLHRAESERRLSPVALLSWLAAEKARARSETDLTELRLESDEPAVQISTVHRSKGLEYGVVFCPFLWESRAVDRPPVTAHLDAESLVFDCGSEDFEAHRQQAEAERLAEDLRLTYVALTRARHRCYVVWGDVPGKDASATSALGYLLRPDDPGLALEAAARAAVSDAADPLADAPPGEWAARALARVKAGREGWRRDLEAFVADRAGVMELRFVDDLLATQPVLKILDDGRDLAPRRFSGRIPAPWTLESFSSLSRGSAAGSEAPDHHDPATPEPLQRPPEAADPPADPPADPDGPSLLAFARGRRAGTCLHHVLERCDFAQLPEPDDDGIAEILHRHGLDHGAAHPGTPAGAEPGPAGAGSPDYDPVAAVRQLVRRLAHSRLPGTDFELTAVSRERQLIEWKFTAPLASTVPARLADLFQSHGRDAVGNDYGPLLARLSPAAVAGYLTGFVDLIFSHQDRWYVIDWKSNYLGPEKASYGDAEIWTAMCHHHYVLQYHLYLLALHRYLKQRLPGYDYERHVAGAYYVFLRGIGEPADGTGWYHDRPPAGLIAALDARIAGGTTQ